MAEWEPALARVYGTKPKPPPDPAADLPSLPPPEIQSLVESELVLWEFWLLIGRLALERHRRRRPHALVNFNRITRLLELGSALGRLACGADSNSPEPENDHDSYKQSMADLERACGRKCTPPSSPPDVPSPEEDVAVYSEVVPSNSIASARPWG
jgi:hypothetical protein